MWAAPPSLSGGVALLISPQHSTQPTAYHTDAAQTPITYVSKHHAPEVFISGGCSIAREHGHKSETVLYR